MKNENDQGFADIGNYARKAFDVVLGSFADSVGGFVYNSAKSLTPSLKME